MANKEEKKVVPKVKLDVKKGLTKEKIEEDIAKFKEKGKVNRTTLSVDWMDLYVALFHPEKIDEYSAECAKIADRDRKNNTKMKNVKGITDKFLEMFFPEFTEEAQEQKKKEEQKKREEEKAKKEKFATLSREEQIKLRLENLAKKG